MRWSARSPTCQSPGRGRLDGDALAESRAFGEGAQHDLGHRRAADVAGADEGHSEGLRGVPRGFRSRHGPILDEIGSRHSRQNPPALRWAIRAVEGNEMTDAPAPDFHVDEALAARLVAAQHPDLVGPVRLVANGWDNAIFRLGDRYSVRMPRREAAVGLDPQRAALARPSSHHACPWRCPHPCGTADPRPSSATTCRGASCRGSTGRTASSSIPRTRGVAVERARRRSSPS